jgi:hypothetical protein
MSPIGAALPMLRAVDPRPACGERDGVKGDFSSLARFEDSRGREVQGRDLGRGDFVSVDCPVYHHAPLSRRRRC